MRVCVSVCEREKEIDGGGRREKGSGEIGWRELEGERMREAERSTNGRFMDNESACV